MLRCELYPFRYVDQELAMTVAIEERNPFRRHDRIGGCGKRKKCLQAAGKQENKFVHRAGACFGFVVENANPVVHQMIGF